jgi:queuine tRNA-ribosyltransferase
LTQANVAYYQILMNGLRNAIAAGNLSDFMAQTREGWERGKAIGA